MYCISAFVRGDFKLRGAYIYVPFVLNGVLRRACEEVHAVK